MALTAKLHPGTVAAAAAAAVFGALAFRPALLNGESLYWHIAAGRWTLDNFAVLRIDPFSYTQAGYSWLVQDWLSEVAMALAYIGLGWSGVLAFFAAAAAIAAALIAWHAARRLADAALFAVLALSFAMAARALGAGTDLLALPLFAAWTAGLVRAGEEGRAPSFKLLPLMVLWANVEPGFFAGLVGLAFFWLEAAIKRQETRQWSVFAGFALVATLVTPYGVAGLVPAGALLAAPPQWSGIDLAITAPLALAAAAALAVFVWRRPKVSPPQIALLLWLAFAGLVQRQNPLLIAAAMPLILAAPLAEALRLPKLHAPRQSKTAVLLLAVFAALAAWRLMTPFERGDGAATPSSAFAHVPEDVTRGPVFNERAFGGFLIFNNIRPYIDGRTGLYSQPFLERYARMMKPDAALLKNTLSRHHVRWTILAAGSPVVGVMDAMPGWHRLYADRWAVVHVRNLK